MILNPNSTSTILHVTKENVEHLVEKYGQPFRYKQYTYFFNNDVILCSFEGIEDEIYLHHYARTVIYS